MDRQDRTSVSRRGLVGALGLGAVALAGCLGDDGNDSADGDGGEPDELELIDHPLEDPIEAPTDYSCPVCNMRPSQYPNWNAQLAHEGGEGTFFETPGCLFAYVVDPEAFGGPDAGVAGAWVTDFETGETIDAEEAFFVREHDSGRIDDPMQLNPAPFADRDDALAYVEEYDDLSEEDVIEFDEVGEDEAELYRGGR